MMDPLGARLKLIVAEGTCGAKEETFKTCKSMPLPIRRGKRA